MKTLKNAITVVTLFLATCSFGQKIASTAVPKNVMSKFKSDFPTAKDVEWKKEGINFKADFKIAKKDVDVWYSPQAKFIKKESELKKEDLPKVIVSSLESTYKQYTVDDIKKYVHGNIVTYIVELESKNGDLKVTFDKSGKILKSDKN